MRKRVLSLALALALLLALAPVTPVAAASGAFADINDMQTARNVEVLRLMGVISGDENGNFQPYANLTRAAFCKMAVELIGKGNEIMRYRSRTIFPDVRASYWASGYINFAAQYAIGGGENAARLIHGLPDGTFAPGRDITFGEAVTIVMRLLGYTDEMTDGIWPQGYIDLAATKGVKDSLPLDAFDTITRAQAAKLFVNLLNAKTADGAYLLGTRSELTTLLWIDGGTGKMRTSNGTYSLVHPMSSTVLNGAHGYVLLDGEKRAITFLPLTDSNLGVTNAAVIVGMDQSTEGFAALTGGAVDCVIYKNGTEITPALIRKNDVATYLAASNTIQLCDTRVTVRYENCTPSPRQPAMITVLGGLTLNVLPTAQQSVSKFGPGDVMTLQLTANGEVAGAYEPNNRSRYEANAFGIVGKDGKVQMLCGTQLIPLPETVTAADIPCRAVSIEQGEDGVVKLTELKKTMYYGELDAVTRMLGGIKLSGEVMIFDQGELVTLRSIANGAVTTETITYAHLNSVGEYDVILLGVPTEGTVYWGRAIVGEEQKDDGGLSEDEIPEGTELPSFWMLKIDNGKGESVEAKTYQHVVTGSFVEAVLYPGETTPIFTRVRSLAEIRDVDPSAFIGTSAVVVDGRTYAISDGIPVYNHDTSEWMNDDFEAALVYAKTVNLYLSDGVIRIIEVVG